MTNVRGAVVADPAGTLLALDFDGTLSPIVSDPTQAFIHPDSLAALNRLGQLVGQIAIVTGRPVDQVRELGRFDSAPGLKSVIVCGHYGAERWDRATNHFVTVPPPPTITTLKQRLPGILAQAGISDAFVEDKGLAVAIHTRNLTASIDEAEGALRLVAKDLGLHVEPGRQVIEIRAAGSDKGLALRSLLFAGLHTIVYAGDDLGDVPAFTAAREIEGVASLLVCSASAEQDALVPLSDVVVEGPDGVAAWLTALADDIAARQGA